MDQAMILPRGITGFNVPKSTPSLDAKTFVADCWAAAAVQGGWVENLPQTLPGAPTSFLTRLLVLPWGKFTALLNTVHPWVGFCRPLTPGKVSLEFVDGGPIAISLAAMGRYRVSTAQELQRRVTDEMCSQLGRGELDQLKYWSQLAGPGKLRVGDIVFNFWD